MNSTYRRLFAFASLYTNRVLIALAFAGCAQHSDLPSYGSITTVDRVSDLILSAPHGNYDTYTGDMVQEICSVTAYDCLIARGYRTDEHPINVNRPTEGVGVAYSEEQVTGRALAVYDYYRSNVEKIQSEHLRYYIELHGNNRSASAGQLEIATVGIDAARAAQIKQTIDNSLAAHGLSAYTTAMEGIDTIYFKATGAKQFGILATVQTALHIETPWAIRGSASSRAALVAVLKDLMNSL